ncbi:hypothetical protein ACLOJK_024621 [Asimina triloba]
MIKELFKINRHRRRRHLRPLPPRHPHLRRLLRLHLRNICDGPFLVFIGIAFCITAFHLLTTVIGRIAMATVAVNDVVAWVLLAVAIALSSTAATSLLVSLWVLSAVTSSALALRMGFRQHGEDDRELGFFPIDRGASDWFVGIADPVYRVSDGWTGNPVRRRLNRGRNGVAARVLGADTPLDGLRRVAVSWQPWLARRRR